MPACCSAQVRRLECAKKNCSGIKAKTSRDRAEARQHSKQRKAAAVSEGVAALRNRQDNAKEHSAVEQCSSADEMRRDYAKLNTVGTRKDFCLRQFRSHEQTHAVHISGNVNLAELLARSCSHVDCGEPCPNERCNFVLKPKAKDKPPAALVFCLAELIPIMTSMTGRTPDPCIAAARAKRVTAERAGHTWRFRRHLPQCGRGEHQGDPRQGQGVVFQQGPEGHARHLQQIGH